jgi:hypothetical protein
MFVNKLSENATTLKISSAVLIMDGYVPHTLFVMSVAESSRRIG